MWYVRKISLKTNIYPLLRTRTCACQGLRNVTFSEYFVYVLNEWSLKAGANQSNISSNITFLPCWMKCWNGLRNYKIYKVSKKKKKIMLDDVGWSLFQNKISSNMFRRKSMNFPCWTGLAGCSYNIHKFSLISNVCTFKLQFEFLNVFSNFEFRFNHKYLLWKHMKHIFFQTSYTMLPIFTQVCISQKL